jgi:putative ABC transport system permease protein
MSLASRTRCLWRSLFLRARVERDLDEEVRAYVEMLAAERVAAGESEQEARRAASIELGGVEQVKERVRDVRAGVLLETILQDLRHGARALARTPGFTLAAVVALALGIGANTAILSVVEAVLLRPLPYEDPDRLVVILHRGENPVSPANFADWRRQGRAFERMGAAEYWTPNLTGADRPEKLVALRLTSEVLPMLGVRPVLGRFFLPEEEEPGREREVILSHGLWHRRFGADPKILGRQITIDGAPYTIVGVMPRGFQFAPFWVTRAELWAPLALGPRVGNREGSSLRAFARVKRGVSLGEARAEMATITARLEREYPGTNRHVTVLPLKEKVVSDVRPALLVLLGAVGLVLLIACANVAHMLLARAAARKKEVAVRSALGASRSRMIRQLLTESLVLALGGGGAGLLLAVYGIRVLVALSPASIPRIEGVGVDGRVLLLTLAASLLTGIAFGLAPAMHASAANASDSLREGAHGSTEGIRRNRLRSLLVGSEFALALVLLVGAGLMMRSFIALRAIDPGFDPKNVLTMVVSVTGSKEAPPGERALFYRQLLEAVRSLRGVQAASAINHLPLAGDIWGWPFNVEGRPRPRPGETPNAAYRVVFPGYFRTMGIPVLRGRDIAESDDLRAPGVVVVNEWLARRYWPNENPIGKRITLDDPKESASWLTVVGVVKDAVRKNWAAAPEEEIYLPYLQNRYYLENPGAHVAYLTLVVRSSADPAAMAPAIRDVVWSFDRNLPVSEVQTMERVVADSTAEPRFNLLLLAAFAAVAVILAAVGIYGVMSYSVSRRTHEIGIRIALGAERADVVRLVVGQGMLVALAGAGAGMAGALALTRLMASLLYGVRTTDPPTYLAVAFLLGGVALAASYLPARRATRIDPLTALRYE